MTFLKCIVSYVAHIYNIRVKGKEALQAGGCTGCAISDFCSRLINRSGRVWICPDFRFQANAVKNGVRTTQNLSALDSPSTYSRKSDNLIRKSAATHISQILTVHCIRRCCILYTIVNLYHVKHLKDEVCDILILILHFYYAFIFLLILNLSDNLKIHSIFLYVIVYSLDNLIHVIGFWLLHCTVVLCIFVHAYILQLIALIILLFFGVVLSSTLKDILHNKLILQKNILAVGAVSSPKYK
ncbi:hypothetical protein T4A_4364 [Trichinella pseudospiralis]|uniref:Uncharacterized protein n=1 Tax=Trichinella pseudospiralis TaxID=6337 RepID=A0A0V1EPY1_TRIPS|nr:hypothetical protein T4A_4364 [Trichinella pseudospiralis]